ncbi:MAG TPA: hypothetical protein DDY49_02990 [Paenibacillaceae bacterium]|nr:hypothetical protein [Paenibacillaceae bacterium]
MRCLFNQIVTRATPAKMYQGASPSLRARLQNIWVKNKGCAEKKAKAFPFGISQLSSCLRKLGT